LETDQGDNAHHDLTGDGVLNVALQLYDFCNEVATTVGAVKADTSDANPLAAVDDSSVYVAEAGRCIPDPPSACDPDNDLCAEGSSCVVASCVSSICAGWGGACSDDDDCARCVAHQPGSCTGNIDCATGWACKSTLIVVASSTSDGDDDGVPDDL